MAQAQQNISLQAPSFQGVNTEDSPLSQDVTFAARADNAVIDELGRIGSRKGFRAKVASYDFSNITPPAHDDYLISVGALHHSTDLSPVAVIKAEWRTGGTVTATSYHIATLTLSNNTLTVCTEPGNVSSNLGAASMDGQFARFGDLVYLFADGFSPLEITPNSATTVVLTDEAGFLPPQDDTGNLTSGDVQGDVVCAAYGRLWVSGVGGDDETIWYSSINNPLYWYDGKAVPTHSQNTGGAINVSEYWPNGSDKIMHIAAHNNMLVVFGRHSILLYGNPVGDPAAIGGIFLQDAVENLGLVSRNAVCSTGSDLLFVDDTGVRSLGRSIQEQSSPLGDMTVNVRTDISGRILDTSDKNTIHMAFWPDEGLAVCAFTSDEMAYVIDVRRPSSSGGARITTWSGVKWGSSVHVEDNQYGGTLMGSTDGLAFLSYAGGSDNVNTSFKFSYQSNPLSFGDSVRQKFPKRMDITVSSRTADTSAVATWGFNDGLSYSKSLDIRAQIPAYWGVAEYGEGEYGEAANTVKRYRVNTKGSGALITMGVDATLTGGSFSLQELNIQTLLGRIY